MARKIIKWGLFFGGIAVAAVGMVLFLMSFVPPIVFREPFLRSLISVAGTFLICTALLLHAYDIRETKRDLGTALKAIALIWLVSGGLCSSCSAGDHVWPHIEWQVSSGRAMIWILHVYEWVTHFREPLLGHTK